MNLLPIPVVQFVPPLVLYSQLPLASRPATSTVPILVVPSALFDPVSLARARLGAAGAVPSMVTAPSEAAIPRLPARSICLT